MGKKTKIYDAVADVRRIRDHLAEEMASMTPDTQLVFLRERARKVKQSRAERLQRQHKTDDQSKD